MMVSIQRCDLSLSENFPLFPHMFTYFSIVSHENQKLFYMSQYCPIVSLHFPIKSMGFSQVFGSNSVISRGDRSLSVAPQSCQRRSFAASVAAGAVATVARFLRVARCGAGRERYVGVETLRNI